MPTAPIGGLPGRHRDVVVENAIISRLAGNWHRRATVKREEPALDELFDSERPDYPVRILPFRDHPLWEGLAEEQRSRILSWAWVAYNRHTVMAEQRVANPAFALVMEGEYPGLGGPDLTTALAQAMVDEQYHTLMHINASELTRRHRRLALPDHALPLSHTARTHERLREQCSQRWERSLTTLAFATVSEISINAYLDLIAEDTEIQVVNSTTANLHNRDEHCHAAISDELAKVVYEILPLAQQRFFLDMLLAGLEAFTATDYATWERIFELERIADADAMLQEVQGDPSVSRIVRDYSGLYGLLRDMDVLDQVEFDWGRSHLEEQVLTERVQFGTA